MVARVGGLADTVIDANEAALATGAATGIQFAPPSAPALEAALGPPGRPVADRAAWAAHPANAMRAPVGWVPLGGRYAALYREVAHAAAR